jgi:hypothetical protein
MTTRNVVSLLIAAGAGVAIASLGRAAAEPQPAWDRDLSRQLLQTQEKQQNALEAMARSQEQEARALQELVRATERMADKCSR